MTLTGRITHGAAIEIARADRDLAVAARNVQHVGRPGQARQPAAQRAEDALAILDRHGEMGGAAGWVKLVQVLRLHPGAEHGAK